MFDSMWHLRGSVSLVGAGPNEVVLDHIGTLLERQRKRIIERGADHLVFDDPLWSGLFGPNWWAIASYERGRFCIEQSGDGRRLRYDLRLLFHLVLCLFLAFLAFCFGLANGGLAGGVEYAVGVFAWLYGMNRLLDFVRVPSAIRRAIFQR